METALVEAGWSDSGDANSEAGSDAASDAEVCVWIGARRLWVSGVRKRTTCGELIRALLPHRRAILAGNARDSCRDRSKTTADQKESTRETRANETSRREDTRGDRVPRELRDSRENSRGSRESSKDAREDYLEPSGGSWVITERWRSVEQALDNDATILDIWNAWGDAQDEIRFNLRHVDSSGDSGRGSPPSPRPTRRRKSHHTRQNPHPKHLPRLLRAQGDTIQKQADRLREQDKQICLLEEQTHRTRMAKHGPNYLLESYLRDIARNNEATRNDLPNREERENEADLNKDRRDATESPVRRNGNSPVRSTEGMDNQARSSEATDSPAANSDSGVGVTGSPPRPHKRRSRGRHLLREHYLTKELTDICQINANRIVQTKSDDNSETSSDELSRIQQQIEVLEKLAIVNKRLQREEELMVRLGAKLRRYLSEDHISYIESEDEIVVMLNTMRKQMEDSSKEIESTAIEIERASDQLERRKCQLDMLERELEEVELESQTLEVQLNHADLLQLEEREAMGVNDIQYAGVQNCQDNVLYNLPLDISKNQFVNYNYNYSNNSNVNSYPLDTLV